MSNLYKDPKEVPSEVLCERLNELADHVSNGNLGEFYMRIPAECDRDADIVLSESANRLKQQAAEIEELRKIAQYFYVSKLVSLPMYFELNIIDINGNPTKLLTGEAGE